MTNQPEEKIVISEIEKNAIIAFKAKIQLLDSILKDVATDLSTPFCEDMVTSAEYRLVKKYVDKQYWIAADQLASTLSPEAFEWDREKHDTSGLETMQKFLKAEKQSV